MARFVAWVVVAGLVLSIGQPSPAQVVDGQWYRIRNVNSNKVLAVGENKESQVVQRKAGPNDRQQWKFVQVEKAPKHYYIVNRKNGLALNVANNTDKEGSPIILWDASVKAQNQQWSLEPSGPNFMLKARHSGLVLDIADESKDRLAPAIQLKGKGSESQVFVIEPVDK